MIMSNEKVWFITGSSRGFGRVWTEAALKRGDKVVATARNPAVLQPLVASYGDRILPLALDVTDRTAAFEAVAKGRDAFGRLDIVLNNAGYGQFGAVEELSEAEVRAQIETNLFGVITVTKAAIPLLREQGAGHIIQFSSIGGRVGPIGRGPYAAAKWGVEGFSEVLAKEVGPLGIKVTIVEPGGFRTDFAGASTEIREGRPEYDATVGKTARFQRDYNGKQPGDPAKAAAVLLRIAAMDAPPLRLPLGTDAADLAAKTDRERIEAGERWRDLSVSTDF